MPLTSKQIENASPKETPYKHADSGGLCLLINPTGAKLLRWRYRFDGNEKMMALGGLPVVALKDARERHHHARRTLSADIDPMAERKAEAIAKQEKIQAQQRDAEKSFEQDRKWWASWSLDKSARHAAQVMRRLEANVFPVIGYKFIDDVTASDVRGIVLAIEHRGARDVAKRAQETIGQIFRFAIANGFAKRNPAADFKPSDILKPQVEVNFARVDEKNLPELLAKIWTYQGDILTIYAMRLTSYLWVRISEMIEGDWPEFDLNRETWEIPKERMKTKRPHLVPLPRQAVAILRGSLHSNGLRQERLSRSE